MKKVKAYSLTELMVVMIISTIVVAMAFTTIRMLKSQMKSIQSHYELRKNIDYLDGLLWMDYAKKGWATYDKSNNKLTVLGEQDTVVYVFNASLVLRNNDSIPLPKYDLGFKLDGKEVTAKATDAIEIVFETPFERKSLFVYGTKAADFYANKEL